MLIQFRDVETFDTYSNIDDIQYDYDNMRSNEHLLFLLTEKYPLLAVVVFRQKIVGYW